MRASEVAEGEPLVLEWRLENFGASTVTFDMVQRLDAACLAMQQGGRERAPAPAARAQFDKDYRIFLEMLRQRQVIDEMV